jgi:predicted unusual protein kinase regulating ubiquinone biosynthesis (AarF/ABC1/UbiB family)
MLRARYLKIISFFARLVLSLVFWEILLPSLGLGGWARKGRSVRHEQMAKGYRQLAIEMGGVLIKVGQFLSARVDMLPPVVTEELSGLQDRVPPEDFTGIRRLAERELGASLQEHFATFEEEPLASASLGQVHRAVLKLNEDVEHATRHVVVKVQRLHIETLINTDLSALRTVIQWLKRYPPIRRRADLPALLDEFSRILYEEIDYLAEGRNAETFRDLFRDHPGVKIPKVIWTHTTKRVLTLEDVFAIKITDFQAITEAGVDRSKVAQRLFETYLEQIFEFEFFHADPHPGNLFVIPLGEGREQAGSDLDREWQLAFVDFGMVGRVPENAREGLREGVIAIGTRDPKRLVGAYQKLDLLLPEADIETLEKVEAKAFERFWGKSMSELQDIDTSEWREFANEVRHVMYRMPFQIPQDYILLGRAIAILSGMCTGLDPGFNIWESVQPFAEELLSEEITSSWDFWWEEIEKLIQALVVIPRRLDTVLERVERGKISVQIPDVKEQLQGIERKLQRLIETLIFSVLLVSGTQFYISGKVLLGSVLLGVALFTLVWIVFVGSRSG